MDKFTFHLGKERVEFGLDTCKFLLGNDAKKFDVFRTLRQTFTKSKSSEYAINHNTSRKLLINEKEPDLKQHRFVLITPMFDFAEEMKLKTKSLLHMFLEAKLKDVEYTEEFHTLSILLEDFSEIINERINIKSDYDFEATMSELTVKNLMKFVGFSFTKEEETMHPLDLGYSEVLAFQLDILHELAMADYERQYIAYMQVPLLTKSLLERLLNSKTENLKILVATHYPCDIETCEDVVIFTKTMHYDLADEASVYENITMHLPHTYTTEETYEKLKAHIHGEDEKTSYLRGIL